MCGGCWWIVAVVMVLYNRYHGGHTLEVMLRLVQLMEASKSVFCMQRNSRFIALECFCLKNKVPGRVEEEKNLINNCRAEHKAQFVFNFKLFQFASWPFLRFWKKFGPLLVFSSNFNKFSKMKINPPKKFQFIQKSRKS